MIRKTIQLSEKEFKALSSAKNIFEMDFQRKETWGHFLLQLANGYVLGRMVMAATGDLQIPGLRVLLEGMEIESD